jgi:outer membrane receptor protein involved in Fe transport
MHRLAYTSTDDANGTAPASDDKSGSDMALSLGTTWQGTDWLRLYARADRFFRYPAIDEVVAYQGYDLSVPFNADLKSEHGYGGEVGADFRLGHAAFGLTAFAQDVKDLISFDYVQNLNVNLADAHRYGAETNLRLVYGAWRAGAFWTVSQVKLASGPYEGRELYLVPLHQVSGHVEWAPFDWASLRVGARYTASSWQGNDFENEYEKVPSSFVTDLLLRVRVASGCHLYAGADNLFDTQYAQIRYSGVWYPANGRFLRAGVQWEY